MVGFDAGLSMLVRRRKYLGERARKMKTSAGVGHDGASYYCETCGKAGFPTEMAARGHRSVCPARRRPNVDPVLAVHQEQLERAPGGGGGGSMVVPPVFAATGFCADDDAACWRGIAMQRAGETEHWRSLATNHAAHVSRTPDSGGINKLLLLVAGVAIVWAVTRSPAVASEMLRGLR